MTYLASPWHLSREESLGGRVCQGERNALDCLRDNSSSFAISFDWVTALKCSGGGKEELLNLAGKRNVNIFSLAHQESSMDYSLIYRAFLYPYLQEGIITILSHSNEKRKLFWKRIIFPIRAENWGEKSCKC